MLSKSEKIEILYMYTCLRISVTSPNKNKDVIIKHMKDANSTEIYEYLRQSSVDTTPKGGGKYKIGKDCGYFMQGKYDGKVQKWMIEDYVNNNVSEPLIDYIDKLIDGKADRTQRATSSKKDRHTNHQYNDYTIDDYDDVHTEHGSSSNDEFDLGYIPMGIGTLILLYLGIRLLIFLTRVGVTFFIDEIIPWIIDKVVPWVIGFVIMISVFSIIRKIMDNRQ